MKIYNNNTESVIRVYSCKRLIRNNPISFERLRHDRLEADEEEDWKKIYAVPDFYGSNEQESRE